MDLSVINGSLESSSSFADVKKENKLNWKKQTQGHQKKVIELERNEDKTWWFLSTL